MVASGADRGVPQVSILDLNPNSCTTGYCDNLPRLVCQSLPDRTVRVATLTHQSAKLTSGSLDLILVRPCPTGDGLGLVRRLRSSYSKANLLGLFCAGWNSPNEVLQSLVEHLDDFLSCPFHHIDVVVRIQRLLANRRRSQAGLRAQAIKEKFHLQSLIGESECFIDVIEKIPPVACTDVTVLILGETGTGKELFARAIHYTSSRRDKPFIPVNCGALPDQLFENEMFGHVKGAFTSASSVEKGLLAVAEGGTLFLDEVDSLSLSAQIKLLRFLQDHEYRPLGSPRTVNANVRIVAASNADLQKQVASKLFREDLYHRLNVIPLCIPPLRDRSSDIPLLAVHLLTRYSRQQGREAAHLTEGALKKLTSYSWPGNVRELEGVLQRAVILRPSPVLKAADIELPLPYLENDRRDLSLNEAKNRVVGEFERTFLANLLATHHGNVSRAARAAGKERRSFQRLLQKYDLKSPTFRI